MDLITTFNIWQEDSSNNDMKKAFDRAVTPREAIALIRRITELEQENAQLKENYWASCTESDELLKSLRASEQENAELKWRLNWRLGNEDSNVNEIKAQAIEEALNNAHYWVSDGYVDSEELLKYAQQLREK